MILRNLLIALQSQTATHCGFPCPILLAVQNDAQGDCGKKIGGVTHRASSKNSQEMKLGMY
jgi:hypothetical protein